MSHKKKSWNVDIVILVLVLTIPIIATILACPHETAYASIVSEATCTNAGKEDAICSKCEIVLKTSTIKPNGHLFCNYELTTAPSIDKNGIETRVCSVCKTEESRTYICSHSSTKVVVEKTPRCNTEGIKAVICRNCGTILEKQIMENLNCAFCDWIYTTYSPFRGVGERHRECVGCGKFEEEEYSLRMAGENSIYIPGTGINHKVVRTSFTQEAVDNYDIVYVAYTYRTGPDDPFVLGHNYRSLGTLYATDVGQYIYLSIDGKVETYQVVISEAAVVTEDGQDIVGLTTGASMWRSYDEKTLHLYTCYKSGRWLVLAKLVDAH